MRVLVVKTSSLGDIIHTFPALSDAQKNYPEIQFDWVVEESMQNIPGWHKAVAKVIPIAQRRWRKHKAKTVLQGEFLRFIQTLRETHYDLIIDAQGLLKSAWIGCFARGTRAGYSWKSAREPIASLFYQHSAKIARQGSHAVERVRALFAECLHYTVPKTSPEYGICIDRLSTPNPNLNPNQDNSAQEKPYVVFIHGTTWDTKHWPETYWITLGKMLSEQGYSIKLIWGNEQEALRAKRIAIMVKKAEVLPKLELEQVASLLLHAKMVISVDTGLGHLAAALNVSTISIYGATDPLRTGTYGLNQIHLQADKGMFACSPCLSKVCRYPKTNDIHATPPCFSSVTPNQVMQSIEQLIKV